MGLVRPDLRIEDYPKPGTMDENSEWMRRRAVAFQVMSARHYKLRAERERGK